MGKKLRKTRRRQSHTKRKTTVKESQRKSKKVGGLVLGKGSFSTAYTNPRIPCDYDKPQSMTNDNIVSLLFNGETVKSADDNAYKARAVYARLESVFMDLDRLRQFLVLPLHICNKHPNYLTTRPYNTPTWNADLHGNIPKYSSATAFSNQIVLYPRGDMDLAQLFLTVTNDNLTIFIVGLGNILDGIRVLQANDFIHGDIKSANCVYIDRTFKLIDLDTVLHIPEIHNAPNYFEQYDYFVQPPIVRYYEVIFRSFASYDELIIGIKHRTQTTKLSGQNVYFKYKKHFIEQAFNVSVTDTDIFDQGESIKELRDDIVAQLIGENNELLFIRICNAYNNGGVFDMVGLRIDLFKRLDIYAFGIMLLELITVYINKNMVELKANPVKINVRINRIKRFLLKLYDLIRICCVQNETVVSIELVVNMFSSIVTPPTPDEDEDL